MKKFFFLVMMVSEVAAQNRANIWMIGYNYGSYPDLGFDFSNDTLQQFNVDRPLGFLFTDASICDTLGNLLFYSNGITIDNAAHDTLENSLDFNPGFLTDYYDDGLSGLGICGGTIVIPRPNHTTQYYLFHESGDLITLPNGFVDAQPLELLYSMIDMSLDSGLGAIPTGYKKLSAITDTLSLGMIAACKHANGRDWWILVHQYSNDKFYKLLVTPDSIYLESEQEIGNKISWYDLIGAAVFSPDGSKYAIMTPHDSVDIYDFDRCTGELSNHLFLQVPDAGVINSQYCMFSPSGRFFYVNTLLHIFQYDLWSADIPNSVIKVATYDSTVNDLPRWFSQMQLAPDNKIYIATYNGTTYVHFIEFPDSQGISCNVVQNLAVDGYNGATMPNFPNYDLGPLIGSPCDTLFLSTLNLQPPTLNFSLSPNPSSTYINIVYDLTAFAEATAVAQNATLTFTDAYGRVVKQLTLYPYFKNRIVYTDNLSEGVYLITMREGEKTFSKKVVIVR